MEQSAKVGGGGTTPSGSPEGSPKPPKAEGSMVTSTGEQKKVSPAGSLSSVGGAVGGVGTEVAMADLSLGDRHSGQAEDAVSELPSSSEAKTFVRGSKKNQSFKAAMKAGREEGIKTKTLTIDTVSQLVKLGLTKMPQIMLTSPERIQASVLQTGFVGCMNSLPLFLVGSLYLKKNHASMVVGSHGTPLRSMSTALYAAASHPLVKGLTSENLNADLLRTMPLGDGYCFNDWATDPVESSEVTAFLRGNLWDLDMALNKIQMVVTHTAKIYQQALAKIPELVDSHWWDSASGRMFSAVASSSSVEEAKQNLHKVLHQPECAKLMAEIQQKLKAGIPWSDVTKGLSDLKSAKQESEVQLPQREVIDDPLEQRARQREKRVRLKVAARKSTSKK